MRAYVTVSIYARVREQIPFGYYSCASCKIAMVVASQN